VSLYADTRIIVKEAEYLQSLHGGVANDECENQYDQHQSSSVLLSRSGSAPNLRTFSPCYNTSGGGINSENEAKAG